MISDPNDAFLLFEQTRTRTAVSVWLDRLGEHDAALLRHSLLVGAVASAFAWKAGMAECDCEAFMTGALLHDVGKMTISPSLLHKPQPLSVRERKELEGHATRGYDMLRSESWPAEVLDLVHLHHERLDGSGYPNGLRAHQLTQAVRMIAICDVFSALIEDRVYRPRPAKPLEIMLTMTDILDGALIDLFRTEVAALGFMAKDRLPILFAEYRFSRAS